jgi:DNA-binding HxlR family transcriptional regulator
MRKITSTNFHNLHAILTDCPFSRTLDVLGNRWRAVVLWKLLSGTRRFGTLRRAIPQITDKVLAQELRELERRGVINRTVHSTRPLHTEYCVTTLGQSLRPILQDMFDWGQQADNTILSSNQ